MGYGQPTSGSTGQQEAPRQRRHQQPNKQTQYISIIATSEMKTAVNCHDHYFPKPFGTSANELSNIAVPSGAHL